MTFGQVVFWSVTYSLFKLSQILLSRCCNFTFPKHHFCQQYPFQCVILIALIASTGNNFWARDLFEEYPNGKAIEPGLAETKGDRSMQISPKAGLLKDATDGLPWNMDCLATTE